MHAALTLMDKRGLETYLLIVSCVPFHPEIKLYTMLGQAAPTQYDQRSE